jgi:hypothetical protein
VKQFLVAACTAAIVLAAPVAASAATLGVSPAKPCYRAKEPSSMSGSGFTPYGAVNVAVNGTALKGSPLNADSNGTIGSSLMLGQLEGQQRKTVLATDVTNPALTASVSVLVSAVTVDVTPQDGIAGERVRIRARGFTTGKALYAHVRKKHGRVLRNVRLARLKGACRTGSVKRRLFSPHTRYGVYKVQFDTSRRYSPRAAVKSDYTVTISPISRGARASATTAATGSRELWAPAR